MMGVFTLGMAACEKEDATSAGTDSKDGITKAAELTGKDVTTEEVKIAYIPLSTAGVTNRMVEYAFAEAIKFYPNIKVTYFDPGYDPSKQIENLNECITQKFDAIMIEAMDPVGTAGPIEEAEKAGIPVITINLNTTAIHTLHIQGNDYNSGRVAGQTLGDAVDGKGKAISIDGPAAQAETNRMTVGFQDELAENYPDIEFLENSYTDNWDTAVAQANMSALLQKYPDITIVYCASDDLARGAIAAIDAAGKSKEIKVYGSMGYPDALKRIQAGEQFGSYYSDGFMEYSTAMYQALYFIENGITSAALGYPGTPIIDQPTSVITKETVESIIETSHWKEADPSAW
jgi:ABC-type sugar transport system substrate-binding protein